MSGKTEINGNVARLYKDFIHNPNSQGFNGLNWDITADWKPLEQMKFNLHSSQRIKDPTDSGGYILVSNFGVGYEHHWLVDRFSTRSIIHISLKTISIRAISAKTRAIYCH